MLTFQAQIYRINDISGWHDRRELTLAPEFQRRSVWSPRAKSYLIDSILRGMPLPQFFFREIVHPKDKRTVREVVDGQQRLSAILGFIAGEFKILPMHNVDFAREDVDVAVRHAEGNWLGLDVTRLCAEQTFAICSPKLVAGRDRLTRPADVLKWPPLRLVANEAETTAAEPTAATRYPARARPHSPARSSRCCRALPSILSPIPPGCTSRSSMAIE